jgi:hypothetical protein
MSSLFQEKFRNEYEDGVTKPVLPFPSSKILDSKVLAKPTHPPPSTPQ